MSDMPGYDLILSLLVLFSLIGSGLYYLVNTMSNKKAKDVNSKPAFRKTPVGTVDPKGWKQEPQKIGDPGKGEMPEGVKPSEIETSITMDIDIDAIPIHDSGTKAFAEAMKKKYLKLTVLFLLLSVSTFAQMISVEEKELIKMISNSDRLGEIEIAKPVFQLNPVELLYDSDGRIYSKPILTGTMNIHDLSYKLNADLKLNVIHRRKKQQGKLFSLSLLYCDGNWSLKETINLKEKDEWGLAGTIELWRIRPLVYGTLKTYGIGVRLPVYGNCGILIGTDYPGWVPRIGVLFRL